MRLRWMWVVASAAALRTPPIAADPPSSLLPLDPPERPFLLLDTPRRYLPGMPSFVRLRTSVAGPVEIAVYRILAPHAFIAGPLAARGVSVARDPTGDEAEALLMRREPLPRRGALLALIARTVARPAVEAPYDDEARDPGTGLWGETGFRWRAGDVATGALPAGLYLVRAMAGGWGASALLSVGALTVLVRRGDLADRVVVLDGEGAPQSGVTVRRLVDRTATAERTTDAEGNATFPASDVGVRYGAVRGDDVAWADVDHVRAAPCDVRVYLATGRPTFRRGDVVSVRGLVRGCGTRGDAPLANEPVELRSGDARVAPTTDADGAFVAELPAGDELFARVRDVDHRRTLHFDGYRAAPRPLYLGFDRAWAAPGETVTATVADRDGAWPRDAQLLFHVGAAEGVTRIGPGHPGVFTFTMPPTTAALARVAVHAEVTEVSASTFVDNELWTGTRRELFERASDATPATRRPAPPTASPREAVVVTPERAFVAPGEALGVGLRVPALGATLLTLERGDVWSSRVVRAGPTARAELPVPEGARGLATVVATHMHAGEVRTATAAVEVEVVRRLDLRVTTDQRSYAGGSRARVTVSARDANGRPRDAAVSLWAADAGWWEIADDDHPSPDAWFRFVERPASAGDSSRPRGDGAEEGRRFDTVLEWNGRALPAASFRHAWGHAAPTVRFEARESFGRLASRLARAAGLRRATVCSATERSVGAVQMRVQNVPWDLAAVRIAEATGTRVDVADGVLAFRCPGSEDTIGMGNVGTMGHGSGSGSGQGYGPGARGDRARSIDGAIAFVGAQRTDPSGSVTIDVPLPDHPGRWRFEVLAVAEGAVATAHAIATTR